MPLHIGPDEVRRLVEAADVDWQVRAVAAVQLDEAGHVAEPERRLGYVPGPGAPSLEQAERVARQRAAAVDTQADSAGAPSAFDWRNRGGQSYVTPVKDQAGCGSCVAFGVLAVVEAMVRVSANDPGAAADLSEAQLFFCYGPEAGAGPCPDGGWWPDAAFDALVRGITEEVRYPYTDADQSCRVPTDWRTRSTRVTSWRLLTTPAAIKQHISTVGPVTACFTVYEDFFYYGSGVYRRVSDLVVGGHCVCIVGYDDALRCWIAKNSWGKAFGEQGYVRIGYGQCGIDDMMWAAGGVVVSTLRAWPVVRRGAKGHSVRTLQQLLRAHGQQVVVDGDFGPVTEAAVRRFQQAQGLTADGVIGARTWSALVATVRLGSSGDRVRAVQEQLRRRSGGTSLVVDGDFGPLTQRAVKAFQTAVKQVSDGVVGPVTWQALVSGMGT